MALALTSLGIASLANAPQLSASQFEQAYNQPPIWLDAEAERSDVASIESVLGYSAGSRISSPEAIYQYFQTLAREYPERVVVREYARSWEGRPLISVAISSESNISELQNIESKMRQLADPRATSEREAANLMNELPSSIWIASSVHGNEISPAESAMVTAYHLLSDQSESTQALLDNTIVYFDPMQNPDGRARFVSRYYATVGLEASADRISAEHNEPWPNGRTNHYLFDMNRDWIALTQPETQGRIAAHLQSYPLIFVDSHEMGGDLGYYFTPEARPFNPFITGPQREGLNWVGEHNAERFDQYGFHYFTREIFDAFYPGYGASWPLYHGSLAMTYEVGSARGHHFTTSDGDVKTYANTVQQNFVAYMATIETASEKREELLQRFYDYRQTAIEAGNEGNVRSFIFPHNRDTAGHQKLMSLLVEQGIEVQQVTESFRACGERYEAGAYMVDAGQPSYRLIRTLLDDHVPMAEDFLQEQERLRANNLPDQIYDVTAWSLPLLFNLEVDSCNRVPRVESVAVEQGRIAPGQLTATTDGFGYVVSWGDMNGVRFLTAALREGLEVRSSDLSFTTRDGKTYPAGSVVIPRADNGDNLEETLADIARSSGATIEPMDSSWTQSGPNTGSANMQTHHAPNIALLWDEPTNVLSAGSTRFIIEREFNYPVTAIRSEQMRSANLANYQLIILPSTWRGYEQALGNSGRENLRDWVQQGGVLLTLGNATRFATGGEQPLLSSVLENKAQTEDIEPTADGSTVDGAIIEDTDEHQRYIRNPNANPDWVSGVIVRANVDQEHWLSAGVPETVNSMFIGGDIYRPLRINNGRNVVSFAEQKDVLASGYLWQENKEQIPFKPLVMVEPTGRGMVISFTQEPNYRAYVDGLNVLFANAIFRASAHARPLR
ncbi:peptidase M14 [Lysobacter sp. N42]|nr:peptidase M14 [Aliidiomarina sp. B3213]TCZ93440.1 peptidase M14 [Lysobacter sp. N42]